MDYRQGYADGFAEGYRAGLASGRGRRSPSEEYAMMQAPAVEAPAPKVKRKVSAYSRAYGAAYRRLRKKATLKSGKLRKGVTHKKLVKQAHAEAKRRRRK